MKYNCETCHDTGSTRKRIDGSLDCTACETPTERVGLEMWLMQFLPVDGNVAWAIHQRALAMAPKQEAPEPVAEVSAMPGASGFTMAVFKSADMPIGAKVYAAPAAANGAPIDERKAFEDYRPTMHLERNKYDRYENLYVDAAWEAWQARSILAAAGPDAALIEDAMRYRHLRDDECEAKAARMIRAEGGLRFESYGATFDRLIDEARAALSGAKGN